MTWDCHNISLIILAGGRGSRLGVFKPLANLAGKPLIFYILKNLNQIAHEIIICVRNSQQAKLIQQFLESSVFSAKIVTDLVSIESPLTGLLTGFYYASSDFVAVAPCDMPFLTPIVYRKLLNAIITQNSHAAVPIWPNGYIEPLVSVCQKDTAIRTIKKCISTSAKVSQIYYHMKTTFVPVHLLSDTPEITFMNINSIDDFIHAEQFIRKFYQ